MHDLDRPYQLKCAICKQNKAISGNSSIGPICWDCYAWHELVLCLDCERIVPYYSDSEIKLSHIDNCVRIKDA